MKDLGLMHYFLGLEVWKKPSEIFLSQSKYAVDVLRRFGMLDCKSMSTPMISNLKKLHNQATGSNPEDPTVYRQIIGSLMYLVYTRSDICYVVNAPSQFMCEPKHIHMVAIKHVQKTVQKTETIILYSNQNLQAREGTSDWDSKYKNPSRGRHQQTRTSKKKSTHR
jgi:hypothetical protein